MQSARFYFFNISNFLRHRRCLDKDRVMCTYEKPSSSELTSLDPDRSSHQTDSGLDNNTEAAGSETPQAGGNTEYLYAAVDKTKKKKPPQVIHLTNPDRFVYNLLCFISHLMLFLLLLLFACLFVYWFTSLLCCYRYLMSLVSRSAHKVLFSVPCSM